MVGYRQGVTVAAIADTPRSCFRPREDGRQSVNAPSSPNTLSTASTPPAKWRKVLPMCPVRSVTYLSGRTRRSDQIQLRRLPTRGGGKIRHGDANKDVARPVGARHILPLRHRIRPARSAVHIVRRRVWIRIVGGTQSAGWRCVRTRAGAKTVAVADTAAHARGAGSGARACPGRRTSRSATRASCAATTTAGALRPRHRRETKRQT
jgi:hypothetical protein